MTGWTAWLEGLCFRFRKTVLVILGVFTLVMAGYASQVRLETAFQKHLPVGHPYIETFLKYRNELVGVNRVVLVLEAKHGDIWNVDFFRRLSQATDALSFMPGIDRRTVTSLWTPNVRTIEITEDGMRAEDMIGGDVTVDNLDDAEIARIRDRVLGSGLVGRLVSNDFTAAMVVAEALDVHVGSTPTSVLDLANRLEEVRDELSDDRYEVHLLGFVTMTGFIARGARTVVFFFIVAFLLTGGSVYLYCRSWKLAALPLLCSLVSGVWQFGVMALLGYGVDPLAILVPFLVFAIGVSHGIQQINLIGARIVAGDDSLSASRFAFRELLVPGSAAILTDLIAFVTLVLIPIPMVQDLGVTAAIGVAFKIVSTLVLLPVAASYLDFDGGFVERTERSRLLSERIMSTVARLAEPKHAARTLLAFAVILGVSIWQGSGRHIGDLQEGATELRADSVYNQDAELIVRKFDVGLDVLIVLAETRPQSCIDYQTLAHVDRFTWYMLNVPGVLSGMSLPVVAKVINAAWNEGRLEWRALPRDPDALVQATGSVPSSLGVVNNDCTLMPISLYTSDHRAETVERVVQAAETFRHEHPSDRVDLRLASGNVGIQAATNEVLASSELPMMLYAYASIVLILLISYRSLRAVICCAVPLAVATFVGYWFMKELDIGVKVSTLPVMVLAVGIGVDYAFYIYSRLQEHLDQGLDITLAYRRALLETGNAVVFTAVTLAIGVATWSVSPLKFQADMGALLSFMFFVNMLTAVTLLPSLAVMLARIRPPRAAAAGAVLLLALLVPSPLRADTDLAREPAMPSRIAAKTLLLGAARAGDRIVAVGSWGHVLLSDDDGASWRQADFVPTRSVLTGVFFLDERSGWALGHAGVVIHTEDGGEHWELQRLEPQQDTPLFDVHFEDPLHGIAVGAFGLALRSEDGGESWQRFPLAGTEGEDPHLNQVFEAADGTRYVAAERGDVYREEPGQEVWTRLPTGYDGSFWGGLGLPDGSLLVFGQRGNVYRSWDRGESWSPLEVATDQSLAGGSVAPDGSVVVVGLGGAVIRSADGARHFEASIREDRRGGNAVVALDGERLVVFGEGGVERITLPPIEADPAVASQAP